MTKPKEKRVAFWLCLFLGFFGAHQFYAGKKKLGACYIGGYFILLILSTVVDVPWLMLVPTAIWLFDLICISLGLFKDKDKQVLGSANTGANPAVTAVSPAQVAQSADSTAQPAPFDDEILQKFRNHVENLKLYPKQQPVFRDPLQVAVSLPGSEVVLLQSIIESFCAEHGIRSQVEQDYESEGFHVFSLTAPEGQHVKKLLSLEKDLDTQIIGHTCTLRADSETGMVDVRIPLCTRSVEQEPEYEEITAESVYAYNLNEFLRAVGFLSGKERAIVLELSTGLNIAVPAARAIINDLVSVGVLGENRNVNAEIMRAL